MSPKLRLLDSVYHANRQVNNAIERLTRLGDSITNEISAQCAVLREKQDQLRKAIDDFTYWQATSLWEATELDEKEQQVFDYYAKDLKDVADKFEVSFK